MQGKRTRARDSRGRAVPGLYVRDGKFIAGYNCPQTGKWRMQLLDADTITDARRERESLLSGLREERLAAPDAVTFDTLFVEYQASRKLSERTKTHERHLVDRHLDGVKERRAQEITATDVARLLRKMGETYSPWTCVAVHRILAGTFALGTRRGILTRSPMDRLAPSERPKQKNKTKVHVLEADGIEKLVEAAGTERWQAAIALAGYAGLRLGEIRALKWSSIDLKNNLVHVESSALPDGTVKAPKTDAGTRSVPLLPALRRRLVAWKVKSPHSRGRDLIIGTADGKPVAERNLRRTLDDAKEIAKMDTITDRLSWHSLRHSFASMLATDLELPATTLARLTGHADAGFTLKVYARDARDDKAVTKDVLKRAAGARIGR
jgi:integrase